VVTRVCVYVCLCVCLSAAVRPHYCTDPDVTWGRGRGCPLVVHYWVDLQSGHGLRCYGLRAPPAGDRQATGGAPKTARRIREAGAAGLLATSRRREAFSTLLRQSGLRPSTGSVLATKSERKMLASTCLYSLYAWLLVSSHKLLPRGRTAVSMVTDKQKTHKHIKI